MLTVYLVVAALVFLYILAPWEQDVQGGMNNIFTAIGVAVTWPIILVIAILGWIMLYILLEFKDEH